jgi:hypothetical protein
MHEIQLAESKSRIADIEHGLSKLDALEEVRGRYVVTESLNDYDACVAVLPDLKDNLSKQNIFEIDFSCRTIGSWTTEVQQTKSALRSRLSQELTIATNTARQSLDDSAKLGVCTLNAY